MTGTHTTPAPARGRARDARIDARVLRAASRQLSAHGYEALSLTAVAQEAGTTRQAIYRRWPDKASLVAATLALHTEEAPARRKSILTATTDDPLSALVAELQDFERGVSRPGRLSLVGAMLQDSTDPDVRARYRKQIVEPRRSRIRVILEHARDLGLIDPDADLEIAVTMCTGSWYGRALATDEPPPGWAARIATLAWRAVGGAVDATNDPRG